MAQNKSATSRAAGNAKQTTSVSPDAQEKSTEVSKEEKEMKAKEQYLEMLNLAASPSIISGLILKKLSQDEGYMRNVKILGVYAYDFNKPSEMLAELRSAVGGENNNKDVLEVFVENLPMPSPKFETFELEVERYRAVLEKMFSTDPDFYASLGGTFGKVFNDKEAFYNSVKQLLSKPPQKG